MQADEKEFYAFRELLRKAAVARKKADGQVMHRAPLGWRNARDAEGRSVIEPDPDTYPLVVEARRMRDEGHSVRTICRVMRLQGMRSRRGGRIGPGVMHLITSRSPS